MNRIKKINSEIYGMDISELLYPMVIPDGTKKKWSYNGTIGYREGSPSAFLS